MINSGVLVLNQNYEPLNICSARRAIVLLDRGKAELLENGAGVIHSVSQVFPLPSVIHLTYMVKRPRLPRKLTRREVFGRDKYICQYCGCHTTDLTLDHVIPRQQGGQHTWQNIVSACKPCNRHKAGRTPAEAHMVLLHRPQPPPTSTFYIPYSYLQSHQQWLKFIPVKERT